MSKRRPRDPLLVELLSELGAGRISEGRILEKAQWNHGVCIGHDITIDPVPEIVDSLLHEAMHKAQSARRKDGTPWAESYVRGRTTRIMRSLSEDEINRIYAEYQRRKKVRKSPVILDVE